MIIAHQIKNAIHLDQRTERAAAAVTIGQVIAPAAGSSQLDWRRLSCSMADARTAASTWWAAMAASGKGTELVGGFDLDCNSTQAEWQRTNHVGHPGAFAIEVN